MKVRVHENTHLTTEHLDVKDRVVCELKGASVEVRQSTDGTCLIVAIRNGTDNIVHMESRAAAIWLVVKP